MRVTAALLAFAATSCANLPAMNTVDPPAALAAAETAFAAHSVREDMRAAFLANFAEDGVLVRDGWTVARSHLEKQPAPPIVLDWRPVYTEVARSGELGLSTGPWKITSKAKPEEPPAFGQFVSVWRRTPGGPWRVAVDLGIAHAGPSLWDAKLESAAVREGGASPGEGIVAAESRFASSARSGGLRAAYEAAAADDMRLYRTGHEPLLGKARALGFDFSGEPVAWTLERSETAASGDFGYARGSYASAAAPSKPLGYFLRVWRAERGAWRIVLDVTNPART